MYYPSLLTFINIFSFYTITSGLNYNKYFEPAIGKWKLLYTDNTLFIPNKKNNQCNLDIYPSDTANKLYVEINRYENRNFILQKKTVNTNVFCKSCELDEESNRQCSLFVLQSQKLIQSIGIFEIPYFTMDYKSGMNPEYFIKWKVDIPQNRLYIYLNNTYYIFEKNYYDLDINNEKTITTNAFLLSNLISFIIGKLLQNIFH
jgi:hypothetical protein